MLEQPYLKSRHNYSNSILINLFDVKYLFNTTSYHDWPIKAVVANAIKCALKLYSLRTGYSNANEEKSKEILYNAHT